MLPGVGTRAFLGNGTLAFTLNKSEAFCCRPTLLSLAGGFFFLPDGKDIRPDGTNENEETGG
jgi:hypothetical protein